MKPGKCVALCKHLSHLKTYLILVAPTAAVSELLVYALAGDIALHNSTKLIVPLHTTCVEDSTHREPEISRGFQIENFK